jgi:CRISPR/Cas system-associated protein Csm6
MTILAWYNQFVETGCVSHREPGQDRSRVADETIENMRQTFVVRSPRKSTERASLELNILITTARKILKKRLQAIELTLGASFERR